MKEPSDMPKSTPTSTDSGGQPKKRKDLSGLTPEEFKAYKKAQRHADYVKNKEKIEAQNKAWRAANPDRVKANQVAYNAAHKDYYAAKNKKWRLANPEKSNAKCIKWQKKNKQHLLEYGRQYERDNKEKRQAKNRAWQAANPERTKELRDRWRKENPQKFREYSSIRRAIKAGASVEELDAIYRWEESWRNSPRVKCYWCGGFFKGSECEPDHITPLKPRKDSVDGIGEHSLRNLCVSCASCNSAKKNRPLHEWNKRLTQPVLL